MANVTNGAYQQMVFTAPSNYNVTPCPAGLETSSQPPKKDFKKKKKVVDKMVSDKKKLRLPSRTSNPVTVYQANSKLLSNRYKFRSEPCSVCKKRKCFRHYNAKNKNLPSKKTSEDVVLQLKQHMLKLLSVEDCTRICKVDAETRQVDVDISKLYFTYLEEFEPQTAALLSSSGNKDAKPSIKKWLYRKIFLDEFKSYELTSCKVRLVTLKQEIDEILGQKKSTVKSKETRTSSTQVSSQNCGSNNQNVSNVTSELSRSMSTVGLNQNNQMSTVPCYQTMNIGLDSNPSPVTTMTIGGATPVTLHNSLTYMCPQVPTNLIFGLGQQQTPAQQQPLNLQTSHQAMQPTPANQQTSVSTQQHNQGTSTIPLNLHNPYYVSFSPMLPLHVPQHNPQQQFQQNIMQPQSSLQSQVPFNQHIMYQ